MNRISKFIDRLCMAVYLRGQRAWEASPERAATMRGERECRTMRRAFTRPQLVEIIDLEGNPASYYSLPSARRYQSAYASSGGAR